MKKVISKILLLALFVTMVLGSNLPTQAKAENTKVKRAIYVVFDNSGSMYTPGNMAWSQATYAMEVFASMMNFESGDYMKVFPMHDVTTNGKSGGDLNSSITIQKQKDVGKIHNMYTPNPAGTPYTQVNNAYKELTVQTDKKKIDEGWLVVLTDGDFDSDIPQNGLKKDLEKKAESRNNLNVQYLAIGNDIKSIPEGNEAVGFYAQKAGNSSEVVNELAEISNRIFKRNEYTGFDGEGSLKFDIPLSKVIVFAQGKEVNIKSLKSKEGGEVKLQEKYEVSYSTTEGAGKTTFVTETPKKDTSLKGAVATFVGNPGIVEGEYNLDVSGADTIKIYYEPDVKFAVGLFAGDKAVDKETLSGGEYELKVGFVNQLTGEFIQKSNLLGEPDYKVMVNGKEQKAAKGKGITKTVNIKADHEDLKIEAGVTYLNNYTDTAQMNFKVYTLEMNVEEPLTMKLKEIGEKPKSILVTATKNGKPLSEEQWKTAKINISTRGAENEDFPIDWEVQQGEKVSSWTLTPKYKNGEMFETGTGKANLTVSITADIEGDSYGSAQSVKLNIKDDKGIFDYLKYYWKQIVISLLIFILILGYIPPFKKRFSRQMKSRPTIECEAQKPGIKNMTVNGTFEKKLWTVFVPYKAEEGRLVFSPAPVRKTARLKAAGHGGMYILNTSAYAGHEEITFLSQSIPEGYKGHYRISPGTAISVATLEFLYTCTPNTTVNAGGNRKRKSKGKSKRR